MKVRQEERVGWQLLAVAVAMWAAMMLGFWLGFHVGQGTCIR